MVASSLLNIWRQQGLSRPGGCLFLLLGFPEVCKKEAFLEATATFHKHQQIKQRVGTMLWLQENWDKTTFVKYELKTLSGKLWIAFRHGLLFAIYFFLQQPLVSLLTCELGEIQFLLLSCHVILLCVVLLLTKFTSFLHQDLVLYHQTKESPWPDSSVNWEQRKDNALLNSYAILPKMCIQWLQFVYNICTEVLTPMTFKWQCVMNKMICTNNDYIWIV